MNGVLDTKHYGDEIHRSWIFRSVGYGHAHQVWKDMMSNLRMVGYDGCISIEHEDSLMSVNEGLMKAIAHAQGRDDLRTVRWHVVGVMAPQLAQYHKPPVAGKLRPAVLLYAWHGQKGDRW